MYIRIMGIQDYDRVHALWMDTPGMGLNAEDDSREGIAKYLERNPKTCFVAEENGEILGAIMSGHDGRRGYIHHTAVRRSEWRRGIGSALLEHALQALKEEGIAKVALVAFAKNAVGNAFWEGKGFAARGDLAYRDKNIRPLTRIDT